MNRTFAWVTRLAALVGIARNVQHGVPTSRFASPSPVPIPYSNVGGLVTVGPETADRAARA